MVHTKKVIVANWKMCVEAPQVDSLLRGYLAQCAGMPGVDIVVCPSFPFLSAATVILTGSTLFLGAQNVCHAESGAYTGEVSVASLSFFQCRYVIVGHSERRQMYEDHCKDRIRQKILLLKKVGLIPIVCIGETAQERKCGVAMAVLEEQLGVFYDLLSVNDVVAYEPVWSIGTGLVPESLDIVTAHLFIRQVLERNRDQLLARDVRIIYGGSLNEENASCILRLSGVDGGLVGRASLEVGAFSSICRCGAVA